MGAFGKDNGDATFVGPKQTREYVGDNQGGKAADNLAKRGFKMENLMNSDHIAVSDKYRDNYDKTFGDRDKKEDLSGKVFNGKEWVSKK